MGPIEDAIESNPHKNTTQIKLIQDIKFINKNSSKTKNIDVVVEVGEPLLPLGAEDATESNPHNNITQRSKNYCFLFKKTLHS